MRNGPMRKKLDKFDLQGLSVAEVLDLLEQHRIGHRLALEYFGYERYDDLVETMHANGRIMPGHQPMRIAPETLDLVRQITRRKDAPLPSPSGPKRTN